MYILLGILIIVEIISGIEVVRSVNRYCNVNHQSVDEGTNVSDSDLLSNVRGGISSRGSDSVSCERIDAEEVIIGLQHLRIALSRSEKEYLDYACDCVLRISELREMIEERRECKDDAED